MLTNFLQLSASYQWQAIVFLMIGPCVLMMTQYLVYGRSFKHLMGVLLLIPVALLILFTESALQLMFMGAALQFLSGIASIRYVRAYHRVAFAHSAEAEDTKLVWLYPALILMTFLGAMFLLLVIGSDHAARVYATAEVLAYISVALFVITLAKTLLSRRVYTELERDEDEDNQPVIDVDKSRRQAAKALFKKLEDRLNTDHLYRKSDLTVKDLTIYMDASERDIMLAISQEAGLNFCDFINSHRVWAVKRAMDSGLLTVEKVMDAALEAGFYTKDTFKHVFKRFVGKRPEGYIAGMQLRK